MGSGAGRAKEKTFVALKRNRRHLHTKHNLLNCNDLNTDKLPISDGTVPVKSFVSNDYFVVVVLFCF